ncbi:MAG: glycosyltransferase [Syntrophobacteraceae bacterium]|jgi:glycosyltransferase involved in cell wall biosynthesis
MHNPKVSFVVPCYKLAHFLPDCINSILSQTYQDFEIIIMDDCSPDNTPEVAQTFTDKRIKYIRNSVNIGHTNNFNKGISASSGKYVWLISADDLLRTDYVLKRYVALMESSPQIGYVFCPAIALHNNTDSGIDKWSYHGPEDCVFEGKTFLHKLLVECCVPAAAGMARKECYENIGLFPTDLSYGEDWYMWSTFAFHYDVGYFSEPMVYYRRHVDSITSNLSSRDIGILVSSDVSVLWRIREKAISRKLFHIAKECVDAIVDHTITKYIAAYNQINPCKAKQCIAKVVSNEHDVRKICTQLDETIGDYYYRKGDINHAAMCYRAAFLANPYLYKAFAKYVLVKAGKPGSLIRTSVDKSKRIAFGDHKAENLLSLKTHKKGHSYLDNFQQESTGEGLLGKIFTLAGIQRTSYVVSQTLHTLIMQFVLTPAAYALPRKVALQIADGMALLLLILPVPGWSIYWQIRNAFQKSPTESIYLVWGWLARELSDFVVIKRLSYKRENLFNWKIIERNVDRINSLRVSGESYIVAIAHFSHATSLSMYAPYITYGHIVHVSDPFWNHVRSLRELRLRIDERAHHKAYPGWGKKWEWVFNNELTSFRKLYNQLRERGNVVFIPIDKPWRKTVTGAYERPFVGKRKCVFSTGAALLARLTQCPIITCVPLLEKDGTVVLEWGEPIRIAGNDAANDVDVMNELFDTIEIAAGERPTQYAFEIGGDRRWNPLIRRWEDLAD